MKEEGKERKRNGDEKEDEEENEKENEEDITGRDETEMDRRRDEVR